MATSSPLRSTRLLSALLLAGIVGVATSAIRAQGHSGRGAWTYYAGDKGATRYSPLDQITRENVKDLRVAWRRPAVDPQLKQTYPDLSPSNYFRSTPIIIDGTLFAPDGVGLLEAFDASNGHGVWTQEPTHPTMKEAAGESTRGADFWRRGPDERVFIVRSEYLYAINARTGKMYPDFGDHGRVNLNRQTPDAAPFFSFTGPIVVNDVIVLGGNGGGKAGGGYGDSGFVKESTPEDIRGWDARSGKLLWTFHVLPRPGEAGAETWGNGSGSIGGNMASWSTLSADEQLGLVYVPLSAPTVSYYGGWRPGNNLYSDSLIALNAKTGKLAWHFQMVHHDLWDYDTVGPPTLADITVDGRRIKAVIQGSKTGFLYVFDRATGKPVWPIEERPVPQSTTPGEHASPTQPFPTKPPPFERQGLTDDDLIDFTPALRAEAREIVKPFVTGPMFTPPSVRSDDPGGRKGSIVLPGVYGGANWNNGAFDPETGMYYAVSHTVPWVYDLVKPTDPKATMDYAIDVGHGPSTLHTDIKGPQGLPLTKPPYGRITAYDMNKGEKVWTVANGDGPRNHPLLQDLNLPPLGIPGRPAPLLTKTLLFIGEGSDAVFNSGGGDKFRAYDKATGQVVWETDLPAGTTGAPMTYMANGQQYIVMPVGSKAHEAEWVAFSLPSR
jgi:quinoprotein glucose dehydrogenase